MELRISDEREENQEEFLAFYETGVFVRAKDKTGKWKSVDICLLEKESLLIWLRSRGGENPLAENLCGILLDYGNLVVENKNAGE